MAAKPVTLRLYWRRTFELEQDTHLDVTDEKYLRAKLEEMVIAKHRNLKRDLSEFSMVVHRPGGGAPLRKVHVLSSGATLVKR